MVTLSITFPAHRYHATAWGTHVNEGILEWPPSPWRLLRAMIASWHGKERLRDEITPEAISDLIAKLAAAAPVYRLPEAWSGHTRHYMSVNKVTKGIEKTTKIFDAFLHIEKEDPLKVGWDVELTDEEFSIVSHLVTAWNYLGRAESLVEVSASTEPFSPTVYPVDFTGVETTDAPKNIVRLLAPLSAEAFSEWSGSVPKKLRPVDLFSAMQIDTADFKKQGWSQPPGSRWIDYLTPDRSPRPLPLRDESPGDRKHPTVARFAVVSKVAPGATQALSIGERVHQSLVSWSDGLEVFTGKGQDGEPLEGHRHTHVFSESNNHRGAIDFVSVYAPMGFDDAARKSIEKLKKTWGYGGHDLQMILLGLGDPADFGGPNRDAGHSLAFATSRVWESFTPFVSTRHPKSTRAGVPKIDPENGEQIGSPEHDVRRHLAHLPSIESVVDIGKCRVGDRHVPCLQFQRQRKHGDGRKSGNRGYALRITFSEAVSGPVVAGYGSHFGLGLFLPAEIE